MKEQDIIYKMAFTFLKRKLNVNLLKEFSEKGVDPESFFLMTSKELVNKLGIKNDHELDKMHRDEAVAQARNEFKKLEQHKIKALYVLDEDYPSQLAETEDPPIILYKLGEADLEADEMISVVGTRRPTPYGIDFCGKLVEDLSVYFPEATIISGLAYGIDTAAHRKALERNLPTVAIVAHGLNMIYPAANRTLAKEIVRRGGAIISEYPFDVTPYRGNFLARNRIVAGISDVTVVVESNVKGGAMSTANYAFMYNREVMALPGRASDPLSSGCNLLIRKNKAHLIESATDLIEVTGWQPLEIPVNPARRNLFPELEGDTKRIYDVLRSYNEPLQMDVIVQHTGIAASILMGLLNDMEFEGIIMRYPGNRYAPS